MEKITYSIDHSPSLFDAPGTEALALRNELLYQDPKTHWHWDKCPDFQQ